MGRWKVAVKPRTAPYRGDARYRVVSAGRRFTGVEVTIIECDEAAADELRQHPDVLSVNPDDEAWR